jgi:hypothetical protein
MDRKRESAMQVPSPVAIVPDTSLPEVVPSNITAPAVAPARPKKRSRAITTATDSNTSPLAAQAAQTEMLETKDPAREAILIGLEQELLELLNQTSCILVRVKRPPAASSTTSSLARRRTATPSETTTSSAKAAPADLLVRSPFGGIMIGRESAQNIERRARGLLLETSLTQNQQARIDRVLQSSQDLLCALQAARYAWQMALLLPEEGPSGRIALPRLKRVSECVIEMSNRVTFAIEGREDAAAAVAEQYRAFLLVKEETAIHFSRLRESGTLSQTARRLVRAALWSITVCAESMAKAAARFALPIETSMAVTQNYEKYKHLDRGDDLLAPLRRR